ncbi:multiple epidermal growth factor-like domains protein 11 [Haliotis rubra]|uniref:multiple epidermal growth factor-like domains protein 11 n=1 Tax=Haliotis rubra TaxID=36100 RepID=UPI001EE5E8BE|nr:multiple epidermal growth factor-like domains protein 11 [Haliotis rubra]
MNGATCQREACVCAPGYTGGKCESATPPAVVSGDVCSTAHPCANGGTCNTIVAGGACSCPAGYEGKRCQAACNTNADCNNKGTCEARGCKCMAGYTGGKCESVLSAADHVITFPATVLMCVVVQLTMKA